MLVKRIIYTFLLIIWMSLIFMFSSEDGVNSKNRSDNVTRTTIEVVSKINNKKISKLEKNKLVKKHRFLVRKIAHFTLYFVLGIIIYLTFDSYGIDKKNILYCLIFIISYAILDEIHQLFSNNRSFKMLDIFIDTIGGSIGSLTIHYIKNRKKKKNVAFLRENTYNS